MRLAFNNPNLKFVIGYVRDRESVFNTMKGVDLVFLAVALKHVPTCEYFHLEAVKTNVLGTNNVLDAADYYGVEKVMISGTDKAVHPINAMGMSKALMEKLMIAKARTKNPTTIFVVSGMEM